MKLELKHTCGYLPYGVIFDGKRKGWTSYEHNMTLCLIDLVNGKFEDIRMHLRPITDITKNINHNEVTLLPIDYLEMSYGDYVMCVEGDALLNNISYQDYITLLEWHFDIYNLIPNGLAIPIK